MNQNHALYAFLLTALVIVASTVLIMFGHPVPEFIQLLGGVSLGGAAGLSLPKATP